MFLKYFPFVSPFLSILFSAQIFPLIESNYEEKISDIVRQRTLKEWNGYCFNLTKLKSRIYFKKGFFPNGEEFSATRKLNRAKNTAQDTGRYGISAERKRVTGWIKEKLRSRARKMNQDIEEDVD